MLRALACLVLMSGWSARATACTCVSFPSAREAAKSSALVFRGSVVHTDKLPEHPGMRGRQRYAVTFLIHEYWRGNPVQTVTLYDLDPGTDCMGAGFQSGRSYLVSRRRRRRGITSQPDFFWFGWSDVLAPGTPMFRPITACMPGGDTSAGAVRAQIQQLGRGLTPDR